MGIKHLVVIESFFEDNPNRPVSRTFLRDTFSIDYNTVEKSLEYLLRQGKIKQIEEDDTTKFVKNE